MNLLKSKTMRRVIIIVVSLWSLTELSHGGLGFLGRSAVIGKPISVVSRVFADDYQVKVIVGDRTVFISTPEKLIKPIMDNLGKEHMFVYQRWVCFPWHRGISNNEMIGFRILEDPRSQPESLPK